ncbi:hypothetical protein [Leptospira noguchii]|uniref:hypothetical protein n=1 Tax=Leptospira noguchii TaxID=28182 RepID=UPI001FB7F10B|nr:hypothetical protein [Leptospira noguchii]UOG30078.1 hypothetical protein MAL06_15950 [Leptospira noguchii]
MRKIFLVLILSLPVLYYIITILSWERKKKIPITGDEPHYLMISESILKDWDFDLKNNYEEDKVVKKIIGPVDLENHTIEKNGKYYSIHSIGTSCIVWIGYSIYGIVGARMSLALLAGILPFLFYQLGKMFQFTGTEAAAIAVLYSISLPFPLAAGQIFPDLPTGVLFILVFTILLRIDPKTFRDPLSPNTPPEVFKKNFTSKFKYIFENQNILMFLCGLTIGSLIWLHVKNLPIIMLILFWTLTDKKLNLKSKGILLGTSLFFILSFLICNFIWFQSFFGPYGKTNSPPTFELNFSHWVTVFLGLFMDRNQGLFFQNPMIWFQGIVGFLLLIRDTNSRRIGVLLLLVLVLQLGLNAGHPCSYGCLSLPGRFQWSTAALFFLPVLCGWKVFSSFSKRMIWKVYVIYQIWIGKYWFDHTASLYHLMEPNPHKRSGFFSKGILTYLPSWTDPNLSWRDLLNWIWIGIFLLPILILSYFWLWNNRKSPKV